MLAAHRENGKVVPNFLMLSTPIGMCETGCQGPYQVPWDTISVPPIPNSMAMSNDLGKTAWKPSCLALGWIRTTWRWTDPWVPILFGTLPKMIPLLGSCPSYPGSFYCPPVKGFPLKSVTHEFSSWVYFWETLPKRPLYAANSPPGCYFKLGLPSSSSHVQLT